MGAAPDGPRRRRARAVGIRLSDRYGRCPCGRLGFRSGSLRAAAHRAVAGRQSAWREPQSGGHARSRARTGLAAEGLAPEHRRFLIHGSSLGGARPKATTEYDGKQWIAKFGRAEDRFPVCRAEYVTMTLAGEVGITVPPVRLEKILGQDIYLVERFDRASEDKDYLRLPFISGLTITGAHENE